jgi:SlyX protein
VNNEERLVDIEIKLSHQEDLVDSLNQLVYEQQTRIDLLDKRCEALIRQVRELADSVGSRGGAVDERPPHY